MKLMKLKSSTLLMCGVVQAAGLFPASVQAETQEPGEAQKPNIIFLLSDDQRNDILGCAGHPIIKTPEIDRLAAGGVRFQNAFVTTSICAASRASILTGLHERTHGFTFNTPPVSAEHIRAGYPMRLREAGYRTGFFGKYGIHARMNPNDMFDVFETISGWPSYFHEQPDGSERHETELCADRAIDFINSNPEGQPFCLSISFNAPHAKDNDRTPGMGHYPWPPTVDGMYDDVTIPPPRLNDPAIFNNMPGFLRTSLNRQRYFWRWDTPEKYQTNMRAYFRMISGIDQAVARIRQALDERGLAGNTVIIYMADNGYFMGERGLAGKWIHYEQSLRVPLIIYDPRMPVAKRGGTPEQMALNIDVAPTILDLAGVPTPENYQGRSLMPIVNANDDNTPEWRRDFFCEHLFDNPDIPKWEGVRGQRYVYARYFEQDPVYEFLHDLENDPDQLVNLADKPESQAILQQMRERCNELRDAYAPANTGKR